LKETGLPIGLLAIDLREDGEGQVHNLGYIFHPDYHGQGFAFEGCRAVMHYLFDQLRAVAIRTGTHPSNEPSLRLLKRLGLKENTQGEFEITREAWLAFHQTTL
jgi:RimJ/RimL family protein N-acetyltransferase